jgi:succinate dehydrogenase / fumarate reductase, membrane anchor subunit
MTSLRTPLARARGLGSSKSGTRDFWRQRVTSLLGLPLAITAIIIIVSSLGVDHDEVLARLRHPVIAIVLLLTILNFCGHMRVGMQVIIEDYVHGPKAKALLLAANTGFVLAIGVAGALALLKISLGG